ncbi:MAG: guanylate kinase [Bryobacteraceae bacterium]|jgi:guanylate kinase|nr:guanylate kinase [Bryobacteraceae bacterium]
MSIVFIISAPSGSGKSTLVGRLMASVPGLTFSVSYTTRAPRGLEREGENYHYVSREEFERRIEAGEFLEYVHALGNYYGTHRSALERAEAEGLDLVLDIEVMGAAEVKKKLPDAVSIFVLAPSREILEARLRSRGEDADEVIERRLARAAMEIEQYESYDYVLINDDLEETAQNLIGIVRAERVKRFRMASRIQPILDTFRTGSRTRR